MDFVSIFLYLCSQNGQTRNITAALQINIMERMTFTLNGFSMCGKYPKQFVSFINCWHPFAIHILMLAELFKNITQIHTFRFFCFHPEFCISLSRQIYQPERQYMLVFFPCILPSNSISCSQHKRFLMKRNCTWLNNHAQRIQMPKLCRLWWSQQACETNIQVAWSQSVGLERLALYATWLRNLVHENSDGHTLFAGREKLRWVRTGTRAVDATPAPISQMRFL